jgi:hypothetical protein
MFRSDVVRAASALALSLAGAVALTGFAPELRAAGLLPEPADRPDLIYTVIDMTESVETRRACPLDLEAAQSRIEASLVRLGVDPVYSPIAEGPDVLTHEVRADRTETCRWTVLARLNGRATAERRDTGRTPLSSLDGIGHDVRPLLVSPAAPVR